MACESPSVAGVHCSRRAGGSEAVFYTKDFADFSLPDFAEDLAADTFATSLTTGHDTLGGGHDRDTEATLHATDFVTAKIDTATGARDALQIADDGLVIRAVLEIDTNDLLPILFGGLE